jgi:MoaE-MoaD fusion protein
MAAMRVHLLAFASAADALGTTELELDLPLATTVAGLRQWLDQRHPSLAPLWPRLAVAVNGAVARSSDVLLDGAEVALLPPVSGGAGFAAALERPAPAVELVEAAIEPQSVVSRVAAAGCGAVLLFLGTVRDSPRVPEAGSPRAVVGLTYSAYRPMALAKLAEIVRDLEAGAHGLHLAIVHRLGEVSVGESSLAIAAAAPHRDAAYEASRRALERLKAEVPIWKLERYADGDAVWREEESLVRDER